MSAPRIKLADGVGQGMIGDNVILAFHAEVYQGEQPTVVKVFANEGRLCTILIGDQEAFRRDVNAILDKYRIQIPEKP